ncbi:hypothetical protein [Gordonia sp. NPDC003376]
MLERLVPPAVMPRDAPPLPVTVVMPPEGIGRDDILAGYRSVMPEPLPDGKPLKNEMHAWSGAVGAMPWCAGRYSATAAQVLRSPRILVGDRATVDRIVDVCGAAVDPLSRYSAGWCGSVAPLVPRGMRGRLGGAIRNARRAIPCRIRRAMTGAPPTVHTSPEDLEGFLDDPTARHDDDAQVALDTFVTQIDVLVERGRIGEEVLSESERSLLLELAEQVIDELGAVREERLTAERVAELRPAAVEFLERVLKDQFADRRCRADHMSEAFERVVTTYVNRLHQGKSLAGTEYYLRMRLAAVRVDEWRREEVRRRHTTRFVAGADVGSARADDRVEDGTAPDALSSVVGGGGYLGIVLGNIDDNDLYRVGGEPCWEARVARDLLSIRGLTVLDAGPGEPVAEVLRRWGSERPTTARSPSPEAAAMAVQLIIRTAIDHVRRMIGDTGDSRRSS